MILQLLGYFLAQQVREELHPPDAPADSVQQAVAVARGVKGDHSRALVAEEDNEKRISDALERDYRLEDKRKQMLIQGFQEFRRERDLKKPELLTFILVA
jgi:hypothetical protein